MAAISANSAVRPRRASIHSAAGALLRAETGEDGGAPLIKAALRAVTSLAHVPETAASEACAACTDAISNWHQHNPDGDLDYHVRAGNGCIEQVYSYPSAVFDVSPECPPISSERGRGIILMRMRCEDTGGTLSYQFTADRVRLRMLLRY